MNRLVVLWTAWTSYKRSSPYLVPEGNLFYKLDQEATEIFQHPFF